MRTLRTTLESRRGALTIITSAIDAIAGTMILVNLGQREAKALPTLSKIMSGVVGRSSKSALHSEP